MMLVNIHTHMLYGVDDGPRDLSEMKQMIDISYKSGVREICLTPHYNPAMFRTTVDTVVKHYAEAAEYAKRYPDLRIFLGQEIYYYHDSVEDLLSRRCLTLNKTGNILIEFGPMDERASIMSGVSRLVTSGFHPLVAHVERYANLRGKTENIRELRRRGAMIQVNAASVLGKYGIMTKLYVMSLIRRGLVDVVADDSHRVKGKALCLREAYDLILRKFGKETAAELFSVNPQRIIHGID